MSHWIERFRLWAADIRFYDWTFKVIEDANGAYVQVEFTSECSLTGKPCAQTGRKWRLSEYMSHSEFVQTMLKAVLTAVEHEAREAFLYKGRAIFGPHFDVNALWEIVDEKHNDLRKECTII